MGIECVELAQRPNPPSSKSVDKRLYDDWHGETIGAGGAHRLTGMELNFSRAARRVSCCTNSGKSCTVWRNSLCRLRTRLLHQRCLDVRERRRKSPGWSRSSLPMTRRSFPATGFWLMGVTPWRDELTVIMARPV